MGIRIAISFHNSSREVNLESDLSTEAAEKLIAEALTENSGQLKLTDTKGRIFIIPVQHIVVAEVGPEETRKVGFVG